jgi:hypothetical protein
VKRTLILAALVAALPACQFSKVDQTTGPTTVIVAPPSAAPTPAPSASPSSSGSACAGSPSAVRAGFYGFDGPGSTCSGIHNGGGELPIACAGLATVTPKLADGTDDHRFDGTSPTWRTSAGVATVSSPGADGNPFNAVVRWPAGTAPGAQATVEATVCGVAASFTFVAR